MNKIEFCRKFCKNHFFFFWKKPDERRELEKNSLSANIVLITTN